MSDSSSPNQITGPSARLLLSEVGNFIKEKNLISEADRVLCMVSGGADSVAMLHILFRLARGDDPDFALRFPLGICHVNYGLRGPASDADEEFVRRLGYELGITVHAVRAPADDRPNFQAWARDFRYLAAQNLCRWQGYTRIAVGHNKDDRIETFIYRLITYSGRRSLAVMPLRRGRVVRPLLSLTAAHIREHCATAGLEFREDESNESLDYARNRIRHTVLPRLEEIRSDFRERMLDTMALLEDEDTLLESAVREAWQRSSDIEDGASILIASEVAAAPRALARLLVRRWLARQDVPVRLSHRLLDSIVDLCASSNGSRQLSLSEGLRVERKYDRLWLLSAHGGSSGSGTDSVALPVPGRALFADHEIETVESPSWDAGTSGPLRVVIDGGRLNRSLEVRAWRPGDRFTPLGLDGSKSIQDLFVDEKVPREERGRIPIVVSGDEIVWVCGVRISEDFKITSRSERVVGLQATRRSVDHTV